MRRGRGYKCGIGPGQPLWTNHRNSHALARGVSTLALEPKLVPRGRLAGQSKAATPAIWVVSQSKVIPL